MRPHALFGMIPPMLPSCNSGARDGPRRGALDAGGARADVNAMTYEFFSPAVWTALAIAFGAGMATVIGSLLVVFFHANNTRLLAFGLAFAGGAMVYVSLVEIFWKAETSFASLHDPK